jgi:hypothetical protein
VSPRGIIPDSYGISFWGVGRRGFRIWDAPAMKAAFSTEIPNKKRSGT